MNWSKFFKDRKYRQEFSRRYARIYRFALSLLVALGLLVLAGLFMHPGEKHSETESLFGAMYLMKDVTKPLTMTVFLPEGFAEGQKAKVVVQSYTDLNPHASYRFIDPEREPVKAQQAGYRAVGNVMLNYDGRQRLAASPTKLSINLALIELLKGGAQQQ